MNREEKDQSGVLFVNDRKESENHPDWKGRGLVNGKPVWISAWKKEGAKGKYLSLSFQERDPSKTKTENRPRKHVEEEDVPW